MWNNGKDMNLREFIEYRHKEYIGLPSYRWDEGLVWAVQDYFGSMGEFSKEDWDYINEMGLQEIAAMCEEDCYGEN